jgi:hypothetical protein
VAHNNDEWIARVFDLPIPRFDQFAPDALPLVFRKDRHRAERRTANASNGYRAVHDVSNHSIVYRRD